MSFFSNLGAWFTKTAATVETDVQKVVAAVIKGEQVLLADLQKSAAWLANETPTIVNDLAAVASFAEAVAPVVPQIAVINGALQTAKTIVAGLQTYANQYNAAAGSGTPNVSALASAVVAGYNTYSTAQAAISTVAASATAPAP